MIAERQQWFDGPVCGAKTRSGTSCQRPAGEGTEHGPRDGFPGVGRCRRHGGSTPTHRKAAALQQAQMRARVMGAPLDIGPHEALAWCVRITAGEVAWLTEQIAELERDDVLVRESMDRDFDELDRHGEVHRLSETRETSTVKLHIWIEARAAAQDRLARYSKLAVDAGVAERQVVAVEQSGEFIATAFRMFCELRGLSLAEPETKSAIQQTLRSLATAEGHRDLLIAPTPRTSAMGVVPA